MKQSFNEKSLDPVCCIYKYVGSSIYKNNWITLTNFIPFRIVYLKYHYYIKFCRYEINVILIYGGKCIGLYETTRIKIRSKIGRDVYPCK